CGKGDARTDACAHTHTHTHTHAHTHSHTGPSYRTCQIAPHCERVVRTCQHRITGSQTHAPKGPAEREDGMCCFALPFPVHLPVCLTHCQGNAAIIPSSFIPFLFFSFLCLLVT